MSSAPSPQLALVPQLAEALGHAADIVAAYCEMAPGIPWSDATLEQMLEDLSYFYMEEQLNDNMRLHLNFIGVTFKRKGVEVREMEVGIRTTATDTRIAQVFAMGKFPHTVAGLRRAIEFSQKKLTSIRTFGFCPCYRHGPHAQRRLRIGKTGKCTSCVLKHCLKK